MCPEEQRQKYFIAQDPAPLLLSCTRLMSTQPHVWSPSDLKLAIPTFKRKVTSAHNWPSYMTSHPLMATAPIQRATGWPLAPEGDLYHQTRQTAFIRIDVEPNSALRFATGHISSIFQQIEFKYVLPGTFCSWVTVLRENGILSSHAFGACAVSVHTNTPPLPRKKNWIQTHWLVTRLTLAMLPPHRCFLSDCRICQRDGHLTQRELVQSDKMQETKTWRPQPQSS
jgi:hypothetical protein